MAQSFYLVDKIATLMKIIEIFKNWNFISNMENI